MAIVICLNLGGLGWSKEWELGRGVVRRVVEAEEGIDEKACGRHYLIEVRFVILTSLPRFLPLVALPLLLPMHR